MPRAFNEHDKELIRKRLLEHGYKLFSAFGLRKTSIEEIAKAAGISKGAYYRFYQSKEALFMDVVELAERRFRQELLATIHLPGPSPRARLLAVLKKAFALLKTVPVLQFFTGNDFDLLMRRIPEERLQEHLAGDRQFLEELVARGKEAGIPIRARPEEISGLLYPLVLTVLHDNAPRPFRLSGNIDLLLELVAAFSLGEVDVLIQNPIHVTSQRTKDTQDELAD